MLAGEAIGNTCCWLAGFGMVVFTLIMSVIGMAVLSGIRGFWEFLSVFMVF